MSSFQRFLVKLIAAAPLALFACSAGGGDDDSAPAIDAPVAPVESICGEPGDPGNELGVGKYCTKIPDCAGKAASICAVIGDPKAHFCTKTCMMGQGAEACGSGASCQCAAGGCGCFPDACL